MPLTKKQMRLQSEIDSILKVMDLDYLDLARMEPGDRTYHLELVKVMLVTSEVITGHCLIDEQLNLSIYRYYFPKGNFYHITRSKRFRLFDTNLLRRLSTLNKLQLLRSIRAIPRNVINDIERINSVRNSLAHGMFPGLVPRYGRKKVLYRDTDIFSLEGVKKFNADLSAVSDYLAV